MPTKPNTHSLMMSKSDCGDNIKKGCILRVHGTDTNGVATCDVVYLSPKKFPYKGVVTCDSSILEVIDRKYYAECMTSLRDLCQKQVEKNLEKIDSLAEYDSDEEERAYKLLKTGGNKPTKKQVQDLAKALANQREDEEDAF